MMGKVVITIIIAVIVRWGWKMVNWVWLKPKKLEKWLRNEGYNGNSYKFLFGNIIELATMVKEGKVKASPITHDINSYALPFDHHIITKYGKKSFIWFGPSLKVYITDPEHIKEILSKPEEFQKPHPEPFQDSIIGGVFALEGQKWIKHQKRLNPVFNLQNLKFIPVRANKKFKQNSEELNSVLRGIIENGEGYCDYLLGILLQSNFKEIEENGVGMSMEDVIEECKLYYLAGSDTTSNLIVWTMICLSMHQEWQTQARAEISQVFGTSEPDFEGLKNLKILTMLPHEVLRLYPPVVMITRASIKETKLGNMMIPSGVQLALSTIHVNHDHEIWGEDVNEFKPERFSKGVLNSTKGNGSGSYFPFSSGPRVCIGQNFAMTKAKAAIVLNLQHFSFELGPSYKHSPVPVFTMPPQLGAHLILHNIS